MHPALPSSAGLGPLTQLQQSQFPGRVCVCLPISRAQLHLFQPPAREFGSHPLCSFGKELTCTCSWQDWAEP